MQPTIRDVARRVGVSVNTVSRALNDKGEIAAATKARVLAAARALNYTPNALAQSLVRRHTGTLGVVVTDSANPFYAHLIRGVEAAAQEGGYGVLLANSAEDPEREAAALRLLREKRVDGILLTPAAPSRVEQPVLDCVAAGVPCVVIGRELPASGVDAVVTDNCWGAREAVQHLARLGRRRIAHLAGRAGLPTSAERLRGYRRALVGAGLPHDPAFVAQAADPADHSPAGGYRLTRALLAACPGAAQPDAIFTYSDQLALGALRALRDAGLRVPEDVAVVGYDDLEFAAYLEPPLTTVAQPIAEMGARATQLLLARVRVAPAPLAPTPPPAAAAGVAPAPPQRVVLRPRLVVRQSCGAAPPAAVLDYAPRSDTR